MRKGLMKTILAIVVTLAFGLTAVAGEEADKTPAKPAPKLKPFAPVEMAVKIYNNFKSANRMLMAMRVDANATDREYIDDLIEHTKMVQLPKLSNRGEEAILIPGLDKPLKVVKVKEGLFSYGGTKVDLSGKKGIAVSIDELQKVIYPKDESAWFQWLLPSAHAQYQNSSSTTLTTIMAVGGLATVLSTCGGDGSMLACTIGGFMTGYGVTSLITQMMSNQYPQSVGCQPQTMSLSGL